LRYIRFRQEENKDNPTTLLCKPPITFHIHLQRGQTLQIEINMRKKILPEKQGGFFFF